ncbi:unnamed protein product, partial [marine sediment metagenome]
HLPGNVACTPDVVGVNLNADSAKVADASAEQNDALNAQANVITHLFIAADTTQAVYYEGGVILGHLDCIAVDFTTVGIGFCIVSSVILIPTTS